MSLDSLIDSMLTVPLVPQPKVMREPLRGCENKASSLSSPGSPKESSLLDESIGMATESLPISAVEIRNALDQDDVESWNKSRISTKSLVNKAMISLSRADIVKGRVPAYFTKSATCEECGPVWLWFIGNVSGCIWCENRINDLPIPRPYAVQCCDCRHFKRIAHPHLGHCDKGEPEAMAGNWDTDRRWCDYFIQKL